MKLVQIAAYLGTKFLLSVGRPSRYKPSLELRVELGVMISHNMFLVNGVIIVK
jgi:hypothetical protein